jgi:hypothetical protein
MAGETDRQTSNDQTYSDKLAEQRERVAALAAACALDERELLLELHDAGVRVTSVWDFIASGGAPPAAVPILVAHLARDHHDRIWQGIVRSLTVQHARASALTVLCEVYRAESDRDRRSLLAHAIAAMADLHEVRDLPDIETFHAVFRTTR